MYIIPNDKNNNCILFTNQQTTSTCSGQSMRHGTRDVRCVASTKEYNINFIERDERY